ncbi:MAG TPA: tyrosine-type recombinase/integrase [Terracidiphilus sp.]|nr:tyrosine-type recombinase/integrase [Terracidiphilus sp.]
MCADLAKAKTPAYQRALQWELRLFILRNGISVDTMRAFRKIARQGPREQLVPEDEFEAVFAIASNRLRLAMILARDAALRRSAIEQFTNSNIDFDHGEVFGTTKGNSRYRVPMTSRLREILSLIAPFAAKGEPLIATVGRDRRQVKACTLLWELKETQRKAGGPFEWSMHDLRRTAARQLYERSKDIRKVQRLLGHASPVATWWYIGNAATALDAADLEPESIQPKERKKA